MHKRTSLLQQIFKSISTLNIVSIQVIILFRVSPISSRKSFTLQGAGLWTEFKILLYPPFFIIVKPLSGLKWTQTIALRVNHHKHMRHINCFYFYPLITFIASIRATQVRQLEREYCGDHCCDMKKVDTSYIILLLYVDNTLIAGVCLEIIYRFVEE